MRRVRLHALFILLAGSTLLAWPSQAPPVEQGPTFKLAVEFVEVDAIVTDDTGDFVRGLSKDDFQILDDGKPQTISNFSVVDIPVERSLRPLYAREPIEPDVRTNDRPFEGRVYVMVIDDWHTGISRTARVKAAARQFIQQRFGANDLMAVVHTAGGAVSGQEFTNNRRLLRGSCGGRPVSRPAPIRPTGSAR
jgi:VWFA-related protein